MKRILALILGALMILSLAACDKGEIGSPDTGKVKTEDAVNTIGLITGMGSTLEFDKDTYDTIISESHPVVLLYYGDENKYPKLSSALEDYNKSEKEYQLTFIAENKITELTYDGEEIDDDKILSVGLQSFHFKNMEDIFGISEDEVKKNAPCKVLATSSMDVLDENLSGKELVTCPDDERWIILT